MKKIPTLFVRNETTHRVEPTVTPGCEWVLRGEGVATRKIDGTAILLRDSRAYRRREVKKDKKVPTNFELVEHDERTGKRVGWVPVDPSDPSDQYIVEAIRNHPPEMTPPGPDGRTYELIGPKVQQNTENLERHELLAHRSESLHIEPQLVDVEGLDSEHACAMLANYVGETPHEGIVWHHPDGRMAKIKRRDFGFRWPLEESPRRRRNQAKGKETVNEDRVIENLDHLTEDNREICFEQGKPCIYQDEDNAEHIITEWPNGVVDTKDLVNATTVRRWPNGESETVGKQPGFPHWPRQSSTTESRG